MTASATSIATVATAPVPIAQIMMSCHTSAIGATSHFAYRFRIEGGLPHRRSDRGPLRPCEGAISD